MTHILHTARLTLRLPKPTDLARFTAFWTSARTAYMGGPWTADDAVAEWPDLSAQWAQHGFSMFVITRHGSDDAIGLAGPFFPGGHLMPELAWNLWLAQDEGQGLAREAVMAARDWFFAQTAHRIAVSYIHPENLRSQHLAEAVGGKVDRDAPCPYPPPVCIYRHQRPAS